MIAAQVIRQVEALLSKGNVSQRSIANELGVSRSIVIQVAAGEITSADRQAREDHRAAAGKVTVVSPFRCPQCGGMSTRLPCAKCSVERAKKAGIKGRNYASARLDCLTLGLELRPDDQARYQEVRRWRREAS